ncbi:hypothetical protein GOODEAATRI_019446 [Goodea atripinnis]|uniref:Uncharacterized protein n=1 Tax=Goodea atripinnis TaxID=208336 RepID=A0ABV0N2R3_9TELE
MTISEAPPPPRLSRMELSSHCEGGWCFELSELSYHLCPCSSQGNTDDSKAEEITASSCPSGWPSLERNHLLYTSDLDTKRGDFFPSFLPSIHPSIHPCYF